MFENVQYLLYKEDVNTQNWLVNKEIDVTDLKGKAVNPTNIHNIFVPGTWIVAQVSPTLYVHQI
jgi:hypothetical protein